MAAEILWALAAAVFVFAVVDWWDARRGGRYRVYAFVLAGLVLAAGVCWAVGI